MPILTPEERVGTVVAGKYRLDRILAQGGMGTVFGGQHEWTHRPVAVKLLNYEHARNPDIVQRFLQEARAAAGLSHPNVVDVLDMGEDQDGTVYMVLELLEGRTLRARLREAGRLELDELIAILGPVMDALAAAHRRGVVHRDLKPDNIFLADADDARMVPKLLDFGIAKVRDGDSAATGTGVMIGTPQYMAPEQVRGERDVAAPADVWSMGVLLYVSLSGRMPFIGDAPATILAKVLTERPPALRVVAPHVPGPIAAVVDRALSAAPAARFADMAEMWAALQRAVDSPAGLEPSVDPAAWSDVPTEITQATPAPAFVDPAELPMVKTVQLEVADLVEPSGVVAASEPSSTPFGWGTTSEPSVRVAGGRGAAWLALGAIGLASVAIGAGAVVWLADDEEPRSVGAARMPGEDASGAIDVERPVIDPSEHGAQPSASPTKVTQGQSDGASDDVAHAASDDARHDDAASDDAPGDDGAEGLAVNDDAVNAHAAHDDAARDDATHDDAARDDAARDDAAPDDAARDDAAPDDAARDDAASARAANVHAANDEASDRTAHTPSPRAQQPRAPRPQRGTRGALILR